MTKKPSAKTVEFDLIKLINLTIWLEYILGHRKTKTRKKEGANEGLAEWVRFRRFVQPYLGSNSAVCRFLLVGNSWFR